MPIDTSTFTAFIQSKGIDPDRFQASMPVVYRQCEQAFEASGATHLDLAKKFFWNEWRKEFPLQSGQFREE